MTRVVKLALLLYWTQVGRPKYFININIKKCWKNICNVIEAYVTIFLANSVCMQNHCSIS